MKTMRRTLALLLTACMLLCFMPAAFAEGPEFSDVSAVAAYIRDAMIARETELVFVLNVPAQEIGAITGENLKSYMARQTGAIICAGTPITTAIRWWCGIPPSPHR